MVTLPEDIILHMIKCTNYPKSQYYLQLIHKHEYRNNANKSILPKYNIEQAKYKLRQKYNFDEVHYHHIIDEYNIYHGVININLKTNKLSANMELYLALDKVKYNENITEYCLSMYIPDNDYEGVSINNFINNNKHIKKLILRNSRIICSSLYTEMNLLYYLCDVNFIQEFPNVEELILDLMLLYKMDYSIIVGSIKEITIIVRNIFEDDFYKIFTDIWKNRYPGILYNIIFNQIRNIESLKAIYNTLISRIDICNYNNDIQVDMHFYHDFICNGDDIYMNFITIFHIFIHPMYYKDNYECVKIYNFNKLKSLTIKTYTVVNNIIISNCANLEYINIIIGYDESNIILNNLPSLICIDMNKNENIKCINTII